MRNRRLAIAAAITAAGLAGFVYGLRRKPKRDRDLAAELWAVRQ